MKRLLSALRHGGLQLLAAGTALLLFAPALHPLRWAMLQGAAAWLLASLLRLPVWQRVIHLLFMPLVVFMQQQAFSPGWYLLGLLFTLAIGRNAVVERVPLYLSSQEVAQQLTWLLPQRGRFLEAGCGDGRLALRLFQQRPDVRICALENAWGSWLLAWGRWCAQGRPQRVRFVCRSFWQVSWSHYDVVYVFLSPEPMARIWQKFLAEGQPGSVLISNTFTIPDIPADQVILLSGTLQTELLIWRHPYGAS
ncbi:class I SAM-dependent methyltransferase [Neisseriaceae bacterium TC5R-5]|nr:class I SAM-dependent methyltransferase [Neisseriaceae bacterium TC5R-5]